MLRLMARKAKEIPDKRVLWPWDFAKILVDTMLTALENQRVPGPLWRNTILIQADRVHALQLGLSRADKEYLFQCGYDQATRYFHKGAAEGAAPPPA